MNKIDLTNVELMYIINAIRIKDALENRDSLVLIDKFRKMAGEKLAAEYAKEQRRQYIVVVIEDDLEYDFLCMADDAEHAKEQCENAYPDGEIVMCVLND